MENVKIPGEIWGISQVAEFIQGSRVDPNWNLKRSETEDNINNLKQHSDLSQAGNRVVPESVEWKNIWRAKSKMSKTTVNVGYFAGRRIQPGQSCRTRLGFRL